ncbi:aminopeptidase, partial [Dysosmobacter sp.]|uniref:aminopeptidase n=1 Tax=Dysosmobacter sp. TaxID=2591382 RepID=UPI003AB2FDB8
MPRGRFAIPFHKIHKSLFSRLSADGIISPLFCTTGGITTMKKTILRKYAQLIAQTGVNVQPGQEVFIAADLDQPEFVKMLVEECYKRRAKKVVV